MEMTLNRVVVRLLGGNTLGQFMFFGLVPSLFSRVPLGLFGPRVRQCGSQEQSAGELALQASGHFCVELGKPVVSRCTQHPSAHKLYVSWRPNPFQEAEQRISGCHSLRPKRRHDCKFLGWNCRRFCPSRLDLLQNLVRNDQITWIVVSKLTVIQRRGLLLERAELMFKLRTI